MRLFMKSARSDYDAFCEYDPKTELFTVLKGSKLKKKTTTKFKLALPASNARNDKTIVDKDLIVKKDVVFNSASTAAQFVVAQSVNGNRAWKKEDGKSFKDNKKK